MELQRGDILDIVFSRHYFRRDDQISSRIVELSQASPKVLKNSA
jgi:hypothetical protein